MKKNLVIESFLITIVIALVAGCFFVIKSLNTNGISANPTTIISNQPPGDTELTENVSSTAEKKADNKKSPTSVKRQEKIGKEITTDFGIKAPIKKYTTTAVPNDPNTGQWWETTLDTNNTVWAMPVPQKQTLLAVVDTGFAMKHEEFDGRLYENPGEVGTTSAEEPSDLNCTDQALPLDMACNNVDDDVDGVIDNESGVTTYENPSIYNCTDLAVALDKRCNMIDDDSNGYMDDVSGWDFVNGDPSPQAGELFEADNVSTYHGTMVAGIAAANANNSVGIAGVDWNTKILPLQSLDDDGYGDSITVGNAIIYATDMGADVINVSLGTDGPDIIILQAIEYAFERDVIVVASAGNDGCDCMVYPAKYDITLSVGSINQSLEKSSFSSYGSTLDIVAPGSSILTSSYNSSNGTNLYQYGSGTSFSAPVVSGLLTKLKGQLPSASPAQLAALVTEQANKSIMANQHKTNEFGYGLVSLSDSTNRSTIPNDYKQIYRYGPITNGGVFYGTGNQNSIISCEPGINGTTPVYKSSKSSSFYSINQTDLRYAKTNGFANATQFEACVLMPHDTVESAREINLTNETSNSSYKSLYRF